MTRTTTRANPVLAKVSGLPGHLTDLVGEHHHRYRSPVRDVYLEELLTLALEQCGNANTWQPGSHSVSTDITLAGGVTWSVKSGTLKKGTLKISGSRLGSHSTSIAAMLSAIRSSSAQAYLSLARRESDWTPLPQREDEKRYHLFAFPARLLDYGRPADWERRTTAGGKTVWQLRAPRGAVAKATITESMSWQLWTTIDITKLPAPILIVAPGQTANPGAAPPAGP
jgi:hypothetical protein